MHSEFAALEKQRKELRQTYKTSGNKLKQMKWQPNKPNQYVIRNIDTEPKEKSKNMLSL